MHELCTYKNVYSQQRLLFLKKSNRNQPASIETAAEECVCITRTTFMQQSDCIQLATQQNLERHRLLKHFHVF